MTLHAEEEMARDGFSVFDIEHAILNGRIVLRQKDTETKQWKYVIRGPGLSARSLDVVFRLSRGRRLIIITVFAVRHRNGMSS